MKTYRWILWSSVAVAAALFATPRLAAHCDGIDGPVVKAAQRALAERKVDLALIWVRPDDEAELRRVFAQVLSVRPLGAEAAALADRYFFETLVRLHRAGEGEPYTGLKPAGRDLGPAIPAADRALETGNVEPLWHLLSDALKSGLQERFANAVRARKSAAQNVAAGRAYVQAYVEFVHFVEGAHQTTHAAHHGHPAGPENGHGSEPGHATGP